tara:strand:+ start:7733 stop:7981 length:249 start_codon:yes stop_codon:yes gene_type:complete
LFSNAGSRAIISEVSHPAIGVTLAIFLRASTSSILGAGSSATTADAVGAILSVRRPVPQPKSKTRRPVQSMTSVRLAKACLA